MGMRKERNNMLPVQQRDILCDEFGHHSFHDALDEDFLFRKLFGDDAFVDFLSSRQLLVLYALNAVALNVSGAHQHTLQRAQTVVVVTERRKQRISTENIKVGL